MKIVKKDIQNNIMSREPKVANVFFIAIDGHGGSGKSTLAQYLSVKLGAEIVHTDDFASWDNPLNWWPLIIQHVFDDIKSGVNKLSYERSKWSKDHHPDPVVDQPVTDIMILEGVSSMRTEFSQYISLNIFVDTPREVCLKRGIDRDFKTGKTKKELIKIWNEWFNEEDDYMARDNPKKRADIIIDGTQSFESQLT